MFLYLSVKNRYYLLFLTIALFSFSVFSACVFFATIIKTTKTGTTAVKFFNFGSLLLGFVIVLPKTAKITKIIFSIIPQINIFLAIYSIFGLENFDGMSLSKLCVKSGKISYMETSLMFFDIKIFS